MSNALYRIASGIWGNLSSEAGPLPLDFQLSVHNKLLNYFQVGDYYYFIFNVGLATMEFISESVTQVLGYTVDELDTAFFLSCIHPDDQEYFINFERESGEFLAALPPAQVFNYKVRYDYRVKHKNGTYIRILQQVTCIQSNAEDKIIRTLCVHTDISHLKIEGKPTLSFIGLNGQPSYYDVAANHIISTEKSLFTNREREVLELLVNGKTSQEISQILFISKQTVLSHRKNLLRKSNCSNTSALCSLAIKKGWV